MRLGELLRIAEAARRVRCCERTTRRAVDGGTLLAGRVRAPSSRGAIRIRPADLDAWLFADEDAEVSGDGGGER